MLFDLGTRQTVRAFYEYYEMRALTYPENSMLLFPRYFLCFLFFVIIFTKIFTQFYPPYPLSDELLRTWNVGSSGPFVLFT